MPTIQQIKTSLAKTPLPPAQPPATKQGFFSKAFNAAANIGPNIADKVLGAFHSGIDTAAQGVTDASNAKNPGQFISSIGKMGSGVATSVSSPLAPVFGAAEGPVNNLANNLGKNPLDPNSKALVDDPSFQQFATSKAGQNTSKVAETVGNFANIAGTAAGGEDLFNSLTPENAPTHPIFQRSTPIMNPEDVTASRIADATPSYKQVLKDENISRPITNTQGDTSTTVNRVDEGKGTFGKRTVNPTDREIASGTELSKVENYDTSSNLTKAQSTYKAIGSEAENLKTSLQTEDNANLTDPKVKAGNQQQITKGVMDNMNRQAREVLMSRGQGIEGDALERAGTVVGRYAQDVADELNKYDGTRSGILEMRKNLDSIYSDARGKSAFGDANRNAVDQMHSQIRDYLNNELSTSSDTNVVASLDKQKKLFQAHDVLLNKAETEATNYYGRMVQGHPALGRVSNILARQGIMVPLRILEALAGVTVLTAAAKKVVSGK